MNIIPTIGRVVWYKPTGTELLNEDEPAVNGDQMHSAMIAYVWDESMVNLSVNDADGNSYGQTSVPLFQGSPEDCPIGSCCWMPYQKQQAEKAEQNTEDTAS